MLPNIQERLDQAWQVHAKGKIQDAVNIYRTIIESFPNDAEPHFLLGLAELQLNALESASISFQKCLNLDNSHTPAWINLAFVSNELCRFEHARNAALQALAIETGSFSAKNNLGIALRGLGETDQAEKLFLELEKQEPGRLETLFNLSLVKLDRGNHDEALRGFEACRTRAGDQVKIMEQIAVCYFKANQLNQANIVLRKLLIHPDYHAPRLLGLLAAIQLELGDTDSALQNLNKAHRLDPQNPDLLITHAIALNQVQRYEEALECLTGAYKIRPATRFLMGRLVHQKMICCDWSGFEEMREQLINATNQSKPVSEPFGFQAISGNPGSLRLCAETYSHINFGLPSARPIAVKRGFNDPIRLGFVGGEFREHATLILMMGLLEKLRGKGIEIIAYDNGTSDNSLLRARLKTCAEIRSIRSVSDSDAARQIQSDNIQILFNLNGFFGEMRPGLFLRRPAPIQVNYLGFPGTLGSDAYDFIIADHIVIPQNEEISYSERVIRLPYCYQPNDDQRPRPVRYTTRTEVGLPENGFIFCCFNNTYKITPQVFKVWMSILIQVPDSVLWLLETHPLTRSNLEKEAIQLGVRPDRLRFAKRVSQLEHLERHHHADLFLDTTPYNAHTTASDALWMGVPVLTVEGTSFAGRVAESMLHSLDLDQLLVAESLDDYETRAIEIAESPERRAHLNDLLQKNLSAKPLFNTELYAHHFLEVLRMMLTDDQDINQ